MNEITGNKGEWSEIEVFLKILGEGRIYGADGDLQRIDDIYYNINRIIRNESGIQYDYVLLEDGVNVEVREGERVLLTVGRNEILEEADFLLDSIVNSSGSFSVERTERFMNRIMCYKLKAPSSDKTDITLQIHDHRTGMNPILGFSIKSALGSPSTLVNASRATNFSFLLRGNDEYVAKKKTEIDGKVARKEKRNLSDDFKDLVDHGVTFEFLGADNRTLRNNLRALDGDIPTIISEMLKLYYIEGVRNIAEQVEILKERNPLHFDDLDEIPSYETKVKRLLSAYALGMQSGRNWDCREQASGGYLILKKDGEILCYHLYNRDDFQDYLLKYTELDTASTTRHGFSTIEETIDGGYMVRLNLQVRFSRLD